MSQFEIGFTEVIDADFVRNTVNLVESPVS